MSETFDNLVLKIENLNVVLQEKTLFKKAQVFSILDDVNLEVRKSEFVALVGESGCGKTMTSLSITNLLPENIQVKSGKILFNMAEDKSFSANEKSDNLIDLTRISKSQNRDILGNKISMIFQDPLSALNPLMKIGRQIMEAGTAHGMTKEAAREKALKNLILCGIPDAQNIMNVYPKDLSGGMMQRVLIAQSLMNSPKLLIADEPTTALDATVQAEIIELLISLKEKTGISVLLITHDLGVVSKLCSRIYIMYAGQIIEEGDIDEVLKNPLHPYTKALIGTIPDAAKRNQDLPVLPGIVPVLKERGKMKCRLFQRCPVCNTKCDVSAPKLINVTQNHGVRCILSEEEVKNV